MLGKLHKHLRQTALFSLQTHKRELPLHIQILYLYHFKLPGNQFAVDRPYLYNPHAIRILQKQLDAFRTTQVHQHIHIR